MDLKNLINKSVYGGTGYISSQNDLDNLEQYILYNLPVLREFKQILIATNFKNYPEFSEENSQLWKKYFPDCIVLDSKINRGHNHGYCDIENILFDWCKSNDIKWLCKGANDVILQESIFDIQIDEADFYYLNGISYEDLLLNNFDYDKLFYDHFYPQGNFYFMDVSKCDFISNKEYLDQTYTYIQGIPNYNGKIWEYIKGWSGENFLKECAFRNNLKIKYLLDINTHKQLCNAINLHKIWDPSHKNVMIKGICHFHSPNEEIVLIS